jgi:hypothetical protein
MPTPSCKCFDLWRWSTLRYDSTGQYEDDGTILGTGCNPITGVFTARHGNSGGKVIGTCQTSSPHISFTREQRIQGTVYVFTYRGDIDDTSGPFPIIVRGRFNKSPKLKRGGLVGDDGDWTAQGTVTLAVQSWKKKTSRKSTKSSRKTKR